MSQIPSPLPVARLRPDFRRTIRPARTIPLRRWRARRCAASKPGRESLTTAAIVQINQDAGPPGPAAARPATDHPAAPPLSYAAQIASLARQMERLRAENRRLSRKVQAQSESAGLACLQVICTLMEARDKHYLGHAERVARLARHLGALSRCSAPELDTLEWAGRLHDIGKLGVPEAVLNKPGPLTPEEFERIQRHPQIGYDIVRLVPSLHRTLDAILHHHENHDGSGYPAGLAGAAIPRLAQILHIADVFDALTSARPYRRSMSPDAALRLLEADAGRLTAPDLTETFVRSLRQLLSGDPREFFRRFTIPASGAVGRTTGPRAFQVI